MASHHQITGWYSSLGVSEAARNTALHPTCGPLVWSCASHGTRATGHSSHENEITNMAGVFEHEKYPKLLFLLGGTLFSDRPLQEALFMSHSQRTHHIFCKSHAPFCLKKHILLIIYKICVGEMSWNVCWVKSEALRFFLRYELIALKPPWEHTERG